jgi:hypothetical protein
LKRGEEMACTCCGRMFYLNLSTQRQRSEKPCCSQECSTAFYRESRSPNWKGGEYVSDSAGHKFERHERPGYVGKYVGSHRLVAGAAIGRDLKRCEVVLRINNNKADDRPENLFICESSSEALKRVHGSLPWPTKTNLTTFINQQEKA